MKKMETTKEQNSETAVNKKIWAVGGGKGGTGKSLISSTLAIELAKTGKEVILIDVDLGGANLHTCLGIKPPTQTLADFINRKVNDLEDILINTPIKCLRFISGAGEAVKAINPQYTQKMKLINHIKKLPAEYIIVDIGAGSTPNVIDFFLISNSGILVISPEPTSVENAYHFLKNSILRKLRYAKAPKDIKGKIKTIVDEKVNGRFRTIHELMDLIFLEDKKSGEWFEKQIEAFRPFLILNQVRTRNEASLGKSIKDIAKKYLGIEMNYIGHIPYDEKVNESIKKYKPFLLEFPQCQASVSAGQVVKKLIELNENHQ